MGEVKTVLKPEQSQVMTMKLHERSHSVQINVGSDAPISVSIMNANQLDAFHKGERATGFWGGKKDYFAAIERYERRYVIDTRVSSWGLEGRMYVVVSNRSKETAHIRVSNGEWHHE